MSSATKPLMPCEGQTKAALSPTLSQEPEPRPLVERRKDIPELLRLAQTTAGVILWERTIAASGDSLRWHGDNSVVYGQKIASLSEWLSIIHPDDRPTVEAGIKDSISERHEFDLQYRVIWPDGSTHWIYARGRVLYDEAGRPTQMLGANINIDRRRELEEKLQLVENSAALGRLLSAVMHEINNPLQSLYDSLFLLRTNPAIPPGSQTVVDGALRELNRLSEISENTLSLFRPVSELSPVDLLLVVDHAVQQLGTMVAQYSSMVVRDRCLPGKVMGSERQMRQVFINLIRNAIEAAGASGKVTIRMRSSRDLVDGRPGFRVYVFDSGKGIDKKTRSRLGEPFFSKKESGTGLGLWVSSEIVRKHAGKLRARNLPRDSGACFMVFLPSAGPEHP
jgi:signal transduction histidine kinase